MTAVQKNTPDVTIPTWLPTCLTIAKVTTAASTQRQWVASRVRSSTAIASATLSEGQELNEAKQCHRCSLPRCAPA